MLTKTRFCSKCGKLVWKDHRYAGTNVKRPCNKLKREKDE